jgi:hypothetical protein
MFWNMYTLTNSMEQSPSEKLIVIQLLKKLLTFMEPKGSLLCSQQPATDPCPEPDASSTHFLTHFPQDPF